MKSTILGNLQPDTVYPSSRSKDWVGEGLVLPTLFPDQVIPCHFCFRDYPELSIAAADEALRNLQELPTATKLALEQAIFQHWQTINDHIGLLDTIEVYQTSKNHPAWMQRSLEFLAPLLDLKEASQVWAYVEPTELCLAYTSKVAEPPAVYVQIYCDCVWEEEHGLQLVLKEGKELERVSDQDGHLFDY